MFFVFFFEKSNKSAFIWLHLLSVVLQPCAHRFQATLNPTCTGTFQCCYAKYEDFSYFQIYFKHMFQVQYSALSIHTCIFNRNVVSLVMFVFQSKNQKQQYKYLKTKVFTLNRATLKLSLHIDISRTKIHREVIKTNTLQVSIQRICHKQNQWGSCINYFNSVHIKCGIN